ncbi:unnamed protein product [Peniophora sp. CBMAI 1063]|nr:unnamed protein product [Peniophora sp. CBMAI 1063]
MLSRPRYEPLLADDEPNSVEMVRNHHDGYHSWTIVYWAFAACALCIASNVLVYDLVSSQVRSTAVQELEFASSYVGLDTAVRVPHGPALPAVTNFPIASRSVDPITGTVATVHSYPHHSSFGSFYPEEHRIFSTYSPRMITLLRFWSGDFGMERCTLRIYLPDTMGALTAPTAASLHVALHRVEISRSLPTWPAFSSSEAWKENNLKAGWNLDLKVNESVDTTEFSCSSSSYQTFALECLSRDCAIDFKQTAEAGTPGIWLIQASPL